MPCIILRCRDGWCAFYNDFNCWSTVPAIGWLLGSHLLMLTHTGRISGLSRQTVLEVIHIGPTKGSNYLVSGHAEHSDWFRKVTRDQM